MTTIKENISNNIAKFRKRKNMSQKDLADELETKPSTVSSWEQGVSTPSAEMIAAICKLFNVSIDEMFGFSLQSARNAIKRETKFFDYLGSVGYEVYDSPYDDKWGINIKGENVEIYINDEEMNTLESTTKENIDLRINKYLNDGNHKQ